MSEHSKTKSAKKLSAATAKFLKAMGARKVSREPGECDACDGYGHIDDETGRGTLDQGNRKCGNCRGTGRIA